MTLFCRIATWYVSSLSCISVEEFWKKSPLLNCCCGISLLCNFIDMVIYAKNLSVVVSKQWWALKDFSVCNPWCKNYCPKTHKAQIACNWPACRRPRCCLMWRGDHQFLPIQLPASTNVLSAKLTQNIHQCVSETTTTNISSSEKIQKETLSVASGLCHFFA